jgi:similar to stage IV sporulation protein
MFLSFVKYISGYLKVQVTGYAPERFLNLCSNHNILMWNLHRIPDGYEFFISVKGFRELKPFLKKTKTKVRIVERLGLPFQMFRYRKRKLYFGGVLIFFGFLFLLSRYIWNIEIIGNTSVTDSAMITYLTSQGCGFGSRKAGIDCSALEEQIRMDYSNIIWTSAQISGTKLTIQIKENLVTNETTEEEDDDTPQDIVADKDAKIEHIITRNGVPQVSAGDEVKKGDLLVSGRIDILDDAGTVINYQYTKSDADIYGYTSYTYSDRFPLTYEKKEPTGNSTKRYGVELAGKRIQVPWIKPDYASSDKSTDYRQLNLFSDFYLPITLCVDTYTEYKTSKVKYTKSEAENEAKKHLEAYLKKFIEKDIQILEKNVIIDINEEYCSCSGVIQTCEKIGKSVRTEQLSVPADEGQNTDELE